MRFIYRTVTHFRPYIENSGLGCVCIIIATVLVSITIEATLGLMAAWITTLEPSNGQCCELDITTQYESLYQCSDDFKQ